LLATQQWIGIVLPAVLLHMLNNCSTPLIAKLATVCYVLGSLMGYVSNGHTQQLLLEEKRLDGVPPASHQLTSRARCVPRC
jgi:hypothetical protein